MKVFNLIELNTFEILKGWIKRLLDLNRCKESSSNFLWIKRFLSCKLVAINIQGITTCELIIIGSKAKIKRSYFNKKLGYVNHLFCIDFIFFCAKFIWTYKYGFSFFSRNYPTKNERMMNFRQSTLPFTNDQRDSGKKH